MAAPLSQGQDIAVISGPVGSSTIRGKISIVGSATYPSFQFYVLEFSPENTNQWQFIADSRKAVLNDTLAIWDTTGIPDGTYTLRLRVVRVDGNYSEAFAQHLVVANAQPLPTNTPAVITPTFSITALQTITIQATTPTATPLPPTTTPTVQVELPVIETATPRPTEAPTVVPLDDPAQKETLIPTIKGFSLSPLRDAFLYGAGIMLSIFLLFGFFSALRFFIKSFIDRKN